MTLEKVFFYLSVSPGAHCGSWTQTLDLRLMGQLFYLCATAAVKKFAALAS